MKVSELMKDRVIDETFEGQITADDMVLAINLEGSKNVGDYVVAQPYITEHSGSLDSQSQDSQYIRSGKVTTKTGTSRSITVSGDRYKGDPFQDAILGHSMKYGTGSTVIKDYVYFAIQNGEGEKGMATLIVDEDAAGAAGDKLSFGVTLTSTKTPEEYVYKSEGNEGTGA